MSTEKISLKQLPTISEINNGDFILVETPSSTNTLDFKDFVIGLENTTFATTISSHTTDIEGISSVVNDQFFENDGLISSGLDFKIDSQTNDTIESKLLPIDIKANGAIERYYIVLVDQNKAKEILGLS